jgi:hypothetical protein
MKLSILIVAVSLIAFISCGTEEVKKEPINSTTTEETIIAIDSTSAISEIVEVDTTDMIELVDVPFAYSYLMNEEVTLLKGYLLESNIQSLDVSLVKLSEAKSDTSVINNFLNLIRVTDLFKDSAINGKGYLDPMTAEEKFSILPEAIMGFKNSCMAECTEYDCSIDMEVFYKLAEKTTGELDNEFFDLIEIMDGTRYTSSHNFKNWFGQVWDYGGGTLMGDSTHFIFLNKSKTLKSKTSIADNFVDRYIIECAADILHGVYMYSPEKVIEEIDLILDLKLVDSELEKTISNLKATIQSEDYSWENCVGGKLQFNCESGGCDFGG